MHIMVVISNPSMGGAQKVAMNLTEWININTDSTAHIVALSGTQQKTYDMQKMNFSVLKKGHIIGQLRAKINEQKPDIVLSMGVPLSIYTVPACSRTGVKHIISERNDPKHFAGKKIVKFVSRLFMKTASAFVFQTIDAQEFYGSKLAKRSKVIPNPLFNTEKMPKKPFDGERNKTIVTVGRLNSQKNQKMLIGSFAEICEKYPDYKLIIWGEGPEKDALRSLSESLGVADKVALPGATREVLNEIYKDSLFILSSDFEGMPNALMEAMALGLPCISTDCPCGGPRALIKNNKNGILIGVNDKKALTQSITYMLDNPETAKAMGHKAFKIREDYSLNRICTMWYEYFKEVVKYGK